MFFLALLGVLCLVKGAIALFNLDLTPIAAQSTAYNFGRTVGLVLSKLIFIAFGIIVIRKGYSIFRQEQLKLN
ncbi:hypothetical protein [Flavobacterium sp. W21_SRS_FM7]